MIFDSAVVTYQWALPMRGNSTHAIFIKFLSNRKPANHPAGPFFTKVVDRQLRLNNRRLSAVYRSILLLQKDQTPLENFDGAVGILKKLSYPVVKLLKITQLA